MLTIPCSVSTYIPPFEVSQFRLNRTASENLIVWIENILVPHILHHAVTIRLMKMVQDLSYKID